MKKIINKLFVCLALVSTVTFTNCESAEDNLPEELSLAEKVITIEGTEWLLKGFEDRVMYTFENGERSTYYGTDNVFPEDPIPGRNDYKVESGLFIIDLNFGNMSTFDDIKLSCDNKIAEFYLDEELKMTLYKRNSNYQDCL